MESHISADEAALTFAAMIERVRAEGQVFVVERSGEPVCRIVPVAPERRTLQDLVRLLKTAPRPDDAYLDAVEEVTLNQPQVPETSWER